MMFPTHVIKGLIICLPLFYYYPEFSTMIYISAIVGFTVADLDLFIGKHRKTLHYPFVSLILGIVSVPIFIIFTNTVTLFMLVLLWGVSIHSLFDVLGGGVEDEPWEATEDRVVYNHLQDSWMDARRIIPYDGSPRDFILYILLTITFVLLYPLEMSTFEISVIAVLTVIGLLYSVFRRTLFSPVYMDKNYPRLKNLSDRVRGD